MELVLLVLICRLRAQSSGTKMPVIIIQLTRINNTQVFGLHVQCSLHGATAASLVLGEKLV